MCGYLTFDFFLLRRLCTHPRTSPENIVWIQSPCLLVVFKSDYIRVSMQERFFNWALSHSTATNSTLFSGPARKQTRCVYEMKRINILIISPPCNLQAAILTDYRHITGGQWRKISFHLAIGLIIIALKRDQLVNFNFMVIFITTPILTKYLTCVLYWFVINLLTDILRSFNFPRLKKTDRQPSKNYQFNFSLSLLSIKFGQFRRRPLRLLKYRHIHLTECFCCCSPPELVYYPTLLIVCYQNAEENR